MIDLTYPILSIQRDDSSTHKYSMSLCCFESWRKKKYGLIEMGWRDKNLQELLSSTLRPLLSLFKQEKKGRMKRGEGLNPEKKNGGK